MKNKILAGIVITMTFMQGTNLYAKDMKMSTMAKNSSADILSSVATVDSDEIDAAKKAEGKKISKQVHDYAEMMIKEHNMNLQKTKMLQKNMKLSEAQSATAAKIHKDDAAQLSKILKLNGSEFDKAYMDMMINGHSKVLDMLTKQFIPAAMDANLKKHLIETKTSVAMHLAMAQKTRKTLK